MRKPVSSPFEYLGRAVSRRSVDGLRKDICSVGLMRTNLNSHLVRYHPSEL